MSPKIEDITYTILKNPSTSIGSILLAESFQGRLNLYIKKKFMPRKIKSDQSGSIRVLKYSKSKIIAVTPRMHNRIDIARITLKESFLTSKSLLKTKIPKTNNAIGTSINIKSMVYEYSTTLG